MKSFAPLKEIVLKGIVDTMGPDSISLAFVEIDQEEGIPGQWQGDQLQNMPVGVSFANIDKPDRFYCKVSISGKMGSPGILINQRNQIRIFTPFSLIQLAKTLKQPIFGVEVLNMEGES